MRHFLQYLKVEQADTLQGTPLNHIASAQYKKGSERESGKLCILRGFMKSEEFSLRGRQALRFEQQVIHVSITAAASEQSFDVAVDGFNHSHRYFGPAVVQDALEIIQQHAG